MSAFDTLRRQVLRVLRVPHDPAPPAGAPGSLRVFRAGRNFYKLRLFGWGLGQIGALIGIIVSLSFLVRIEREVADYRAEIRRSAAPAATSVNSGSPSGAPASSGNPTPAAQSPAEPSADAPKKKTRPRGNSRDRAWTGLYRVVERWPAWIFPVLKVLEFAGILLYLVQIPITYAMARLDYELRWYLVTDRSLRIRAGIAVVQETTMSFANIQQVVVSQGPVQRLLGLADVRVQSAGGGGDKHEHGGGDSLHTSVFHGVDNAHEIRDLILERLRIFREAGLGDPEDARHAAVHVGSMPFATTDALAAATELLHEARALHAVAVR